MQDLYEHRMHFPQYQRQNLMAKIVDAESLLHACGIAHRDIHPRNIIVCGSDLGDTDSRIVLIDFGSSILIESRSVNDPDLQISPLLRWDVRRLAHSDFEALGWIDWDWQAWLEQRWSNSESCAPITDDSREHWLGWFDNPPPPFDWWPPPMVVPADGASR